MNIFLHEKANRLYGNQMFYPSKYMLNVGLWQGPLRVVKDEKMVVGGCGCGGADGADGGGGCGDGENVDLLSEACTCCEEEEG